MTDRWLRRGVPNGRGLFISFEGTDGSGKSTQMRILVERLRSEGVAVVENQEPGGTHIGRQIRRILLDPAHQEMDAMTELLLMFASRTQAVAEIIKPALERGDVVVTDRFTDSTLAYQGAGRGIGFDTVLAVHKLALGDLAPHLTICLTIDVETGLRRAHQRNSAGNGEENEARLDLQSLAFHQRVEDGYRRIALQEPERFRLVPGDAEAAVVAERVWRDVAPLLSCR